MKLNFWIKNRVLAQCVHKVIKEESMKKLTSRGNDDVAKQNVSSHAHQKYQSVQNETEDPEMSHKCL